MKELEVKAKSLKFLINSKIYADLWVEWDLSQLNWKDIWFRISIEGSILLTWVKYKNIFWGSNAIWWRNRNFSIILCIKMLFTYLVEYPHLGNPKIQGTCKVNFEVIRRSQRYFVIARVHCLPGLFDILQNESVFKCSEAGEKVTIVM